MASLHDAATMERAPAMISSTQSLTATEGLRKPPIGGLAKHRKTSSVDLGAFNPQRQGLPRRVPSVSKLVEQYAEDLGGDRAIFSVLVANNGLAAVKFMRSVRSWANQALGNPRAISLVAIATPDDIRINAEHVQLADQFVEVPGGSNNNNYANVELIVELAQRADVDALWPGWGHASEKPELPAALAERDIRFLGPPAAAMAALGDKIGSTILAQAAGVPTLPWSGTGVAVSFADCGGVIPEDVYARACISSVDEALRSCREIGYPVMLKASWGGGGKGIRKVHSDDEVIATFRQVQGEVPGSPVFGMKLAPASRHLEVQLLCDRHGNVTSLLSRDCSVQRRHQKIIEEGPATAASMDQLMSMEACARALARSVGYVGAATVEFLYCLNEKKYYFLELNPRLQVEHPVTEGITGINLPACQLMIGMGIPLWRIPAIRQLYNQDPSASERFDLETTRQRGADGHVVAVRITSEDAGDGFKPTCGRIDELHFRPTPEVWGYFSVKSGGGIHEFSDSQFGHLFAKGVTRDAAIRAMCVALRDVVIRGEIRTITDYALGMLTSNDFVGNNIHTGWLDARIASKVPAGRPPWHLSVVAGAVVKCFESVSSCSAEYLSYLKKGQLPPATVSLTAFSDVLVIERMKYAVSVLRRGPTNFSVSVNGSTVDVITRKMVDGGFLIQVDGESHVVHVEEEAMGTRLIVNSLTVLLAKAADPSRLVSSSPGKLVRHLVPSGHHVDEGEPYAEVEVMKMMMSLLAPASGVLCFQLPEGSALNAGDLIARLDLDDGSAVVQTEAYTGSFPELGPPQVPSTRIDQRFKAAWDAAKMVMAGYPHPLDAVMADLVSSLDSPRLALLQWTDEYVVIRRRLPSALAQRLEAIIERHEEDVTTLEAAQDRLALQVKCELPAQALTQAMDRAVQEEFVGERAQLQSVLAPLQAVAVRHAGGKEEYARNLVKQLLSDFLAVEENFRLNGAVTTEQEVIDALRKTHAGDLKAVLDMVVSHQGLPDKVDLVKRLLTTLVMPAPAHYRPQLRRLAALNIKGAERLALRAQHLLEHSLLADLRVVVARALSGLDMFSNGAVDGVGSPPSSTLARGVEAGSSGDSVVRRTTVAEGLYRGLASHVAGRSSAPGAMPAQIESKMEMLVGVPAAVDDALASLIVDHEDDTIVLRAMLTYVRRTYYPFLLREPLRSDSGGVLRAIWLYEDPALANSGAAARQRYGAMVVVDDLGGLPAGLDLVGDLLMRLDITTELGTLHVAVSGDEGSGSADLTRTFSGTVLDTGGEEHTEGSLLVAEAELPVAAASLRVVTRRLAAAVAAAAGVLRAMRIDCVSLLCKGSSAAPLRCGFVWDNEAQLFRFDRFLRQVEPPVADLLELRKLSSVQPLHYSPSRNRQWHAYTASERPDPRSYSLRRTYVRCLLRQLGHPALLAASYTGNSAAVAGAAVAELEESLVSCLQELNRSHSAAASGGAASRPDWVHMYYSVLPALPLQSGPKDDVKVAGALRSAAAALVAKHIGELRQAAVAVWEFRLRPVQREPAWRVVVSLPTGHESGDEHVEVYREADCSTNSGGPTTPGTPALPALGYWTLPGDSATHAGGCGTARAALHGQLLLTAYPPLEPLQCKRLAARRHTVTYCYDFPTVFENALREIWAARAAAGEPCSTPVAGHLVEVEELVLPTTTTFRERGTLSRVARPIGSNTCGMVAWSWTLRTPECPQGRQIVALANDITWQSGAFSPAEDAVFRAATEYALEEKLPLVYLTANSGARVGLANEIKECLRVRWVDPQEPARGFASLYLDDSDYQRLVAAATPNQQLLKAKRETSESGETTWTLTDVVGMEDGLGVECLSGSGAIASAYCRAFREGWTATLVSGRTVGIGAYLARLGRRVVQRLDQPIILTGFAALNKLLGRQVYTSHMQLGGPRVMSANGVSHLTVSDDLDGARAILRLLAFAPPAMGERPASIASADPVDRPVVYAPTGSDKLDPRAAIAGVDTPSEAIRSSVPGTCIPPPPEPHAPWQSGLFDRGSWLELQAGWARTVVTGRARLGGIPVGVIAVETQTVQRHLPADPGMPESSEQVIPQAGQVWFPDSADKTAQAIEECNLEGLPLFILANWRGFSGGQRDLFDGVLQAGSLIVDQLRCYQHPVFVYIPCGAELRGGAWVVVDSQINSAQLEMYADPTARGGVLEPDGVVEIKFRAPELIKMMHRLDPQLLSLKADGAGADAPGVKARERALLPVYQQVARHFADMHDTPVRMLAKGALRGIVPWAQARRFFALRLQRRLMEETFVHHIHNTDASILRSEAVDMIRTWHSAAHCEWQDMTSPRSPIPRLKTAAQGTHGMVAGSPSAAAAGRSDDISPFAVSAAAAAAGTSSCPSLEAALAGLDSAALFEAQLDEDRSFLAWAASSTGRAHVASELKALRARSAAQMVMQVLGTAEGKDGLLHALQGAMKRDTVLALQLKMLLNEMRC